MSSGRATATTVIITAIIIVQIANAAYYQPHGHGLLSSLNPYTSSKSQYFRTKTLRISSMSDETTAGIDRGSLHPRMSTIRSVKEFINFLSEDDRVCVVKFHAEWCKSCQKIHSRYRKLANCYADKLDGRDELQSPGLVRFAEVDIAINAKLCRTLGVKDLPTFQMYKGKERLCECICTPKDFQYLVQEKLEEHLGLGDGQSDCIIECIIDEDDL